MFPNTNIIIHLLQYSTSNDCVCLVAVIIGAKNETHGRAQAAVAAHTIFMSTLMHALQLITDWDRLWLWVCVCVSVSTMENIRHRTYTR